MNDNANNSPAEAPRVKLKKVKRPIRKIQPQVPATDNSSLAQTNPFQQKLEPAPKAVDAFNADNILNVSNLPAVNTTKPETATSTQPQFLDDENETYGNDYYQMESSGGNKKMTLVVAAFAAFVVGFFFSRMFFSEQQVTRSGLQGVVVNAEIPQGRARCGVAESGQGCVLYIMNPQRQELNARDFYDLAAQLTGRQRFVIETGNMRYSNMKIRPGEIGQFNIPPLTQ